jgi:menaquinone-dependent protoporphyrinogen oxidase
MERVLIVYATREGQTEKIARRMCAVIESTGHPVELIDADHPAPGPWLERAGAILVGSPIRARGYLPSVVRFIRKHRSTLERVPSAFFSVGLAVASKTHEGRAQTRRRVEDLSATTGWYPKRVELLAGALQYSKYGFLTRWMMRRIARNEGGDTDTSRDYEYTDWSAVDRFARASVSGASPAEAAQATSSVR